MGRKAKRAKVLVRKMRITGQEIDPVVARRCGVEKQNQKLIDARLEKEAEEKRLAEEAERVASLGGTHLLSRGASTMRNLPAFSYQFLAAPCE